MIYLSIYHCHSFYRTSTTYYKGSSLTETEYGYYCFSSEENSEEYEVSRVDVKYL
jgi:hypothetical protein